MMRNARFFCLALAGATLFIGNAALANPPGNMPMYGGMMGRSMDMPRGMGQQGDCGMGDKYGSEHYGHMLNTRQMEALDLNAEQRKQITDLRRDLRNKTWDLKRQEIDQREQLGMLYSSDSLDVAAIKSAYEKLFQVKLKLIEHSLNFKQSLEKILTKEQMKQFHQMMQGPMGRGHGGRMDMDGPMDMQ